MGGGGEKLVADYESRCETNKVNLNFTVTERLGCEVHNCNSRNAGSVRLEIAITSNKYLPFLCDALNQSSAGRVKFSGNWS